MQWKEVAASILLVVVPFCVCDQNRRGDIANSVEGSGTGRPTEKIGIASTVDSLYSHGFDTALQEHVRLHSGFS